MHGQDFMGIIRVRIFYTPVTCLCGNEHVITKVKRNYRLIYLKFPLPNASGAVNAACHDSFYQWPYIFVFNSPLEIKTKLITACECELQLEKIRMLHEHVHVQ